MTKTATNHFISYFEIIFTIAFFSFWIVRAFTYVPHDFSNTYFGAYFLLHDEFDLGIFDPYTFNKRIYDTGFHNIFASFNPNPPSTAVLFFPFALLPLYISKLVFNILSCSLFCVSLYRLCKHLNIDPKKIFILLPFLFFVPIRNQILFGQTYFLIFSLVTEGYLAYANKKDILAASFWSLAIMIKIFPAIIFLFLILRKEWRQALLLGTACLLIISACLLFQGIPIWKHYLIEILPRSGAGDLHSSYTTGTQSVHMLLKYLFLDDPVFNPSPLIKSSVFFYTALSVWSALILSIAIKSITQLSDKLLILGLLLLCSQLISPQGSTYSTLLLLFILISIYGQQEKMALIILAILTLFISNASVSLFHDSSFILFRFSRLLLIVILFIVLIWHSKILPDLKVIFICSLCLVGIKLWQHSKERDSSVRWIDTEFNSLIVDYQIKDEKIVYSSWTDQGLKKITTSQHVSKISTTDVMIENNQVFYQGQQFTNSSDNKKKPTIVDDEYIIYLSDKDKGIGFYAIRKIKVP